MKFRTTKDAFYTGINIVNKAVPTSTTMDNLKNIKISAYNGVIKLLANDMDLAIETIIEGSSTEDGEICVDAKLINSVLRGFPNNDIVVETRGTSEVVLTYNEERNSNTVINYFRTEEFPELPYYEKENPLNISQFTLKELIRTTIFSISDNESNKIMTGELFEIKNNQLKAVSLDGHRISIRKEDLKDSYEDKKVIIPGKVLGELSKIISSEIDKDVNIYFNKNNVVFEFDDTVMISRLIEGEYFKVDQMISNEYSIKVKLNKKDLVDGIGRAVPFVHEGEKKPVKFNFTDDSLTMTIVSQEGGNNDYINIEKEGNDIIIGFNPKYILDAARVIDSEEITIYMVNSKAPCFIKDDNESYLYLILPVNFN